MGAFEREAVGRSPSSARIRPLACGLISTADLRPQIPAERARRAVSTSLCRAFQQGYARNPWRTSRQPGVQQLWCRCPQTVIHRSSTTTVGGDRLSAGRRGRPHDEGRHRLPHQTAVPRHSPTDLWPARQALNQGAGPGTGRTPPSGLPFRPSACGMTSTGNDRPEAAARRALPRLSTSLSRASQQGYPRNLCRTRCQSAAEVLLNACRFDAKRSRGRSRSADLGSPPPGPGRRAQWLLSMAAGCDGVAVGQGRRAFRQVATGPGALPAQA